MTHNRTKKFVDKLPEFERLYNNSYDRSIKMTPLQVSKANEREVYNNLYSVVTMDYTRPKFKLDDHVLVARTKKAFEKGQVS
jgi:hypothetical protein